MRNKLRTKLTMRQQLLLGFSVPVILIFSAGMAAVYPRVYGTYMANTEYSIRQTCQQAASFVGAYFQNMAEVADLIATDPEVCRIVGDPSFLRERTKREEFEEYQAIYGALERINQSFPSYRVCIYLPDQIGYTVNRFHIYPESEMKQTGAGAWYEDSARRLYPWFTFDAERALVSSTDRDYRALAVYRAVGADETGVPAGAAKVSISADQISAILSNANVSGKAVAMLLDEAGTVLYSTGGAAEGTMLPEGVAGMLFEPDHSMHQVRLGDQGYYALGSSVIEPAGWRLVLAVPQGEIRRQTLNYFSILATIFVLLILSIIVVAYAMARHYTKRLEELSDHMRQLREGNLNTGYYELRDSRDEFDQIGQGFNYMMQQLRGLMQEHYRMGKAVKTSELRALQAQINPHFLYNTLDLINWMAMDFGTTEIAEIAQNLARFYRLSLNRGRSILSIGEEVEHVRAYVNIENFHFADAIRLETEVPEEVTELGCPNIILQPFVENAIVHGIAEHEEITACSIRIRAERDGDDVVFAVEDDGPGMGEELARELETAEISQLTRGYGVKNINTRLKLYFGERCGVRYESREGEGTTVRIRIPAMTVEEMEKSIV